MLASQFLKSSMRIRKGIGYSLTPWDVGALIRCCWPKLAKDGGTKTRGQPGMVLTFFSQYLDSISQGGTANAKVCSLFLRSPGVDLDQFVELCATKGIMYDRGAAMKAAAAVMPWK